MQITKVPPRVERSELTPFFQPHTPLKTNVPRYPAWVARLRTTGQSSHAQDPPETESDKQKDTGEVYPGMEMENARDDSSRRVETSDVKCSNKEGQGDKNAVGFRDPEPEPVLAPTGKHTEGAPQRRRGENTSEEAISEMEQHPPVVAPKKQGSRQVDLTPHPNVPMPPQPATVVKTLVANTPVLTS